MTTTPTITNPPTIKPPHGRASIIKLFGNPSNPDGTLNKDWEKANIITAKPAGWTLYYQDGQRLVPTSGIRIHRLIVPAFNRAMAEIWAYAATQIGGQPTDSQIRSLLHQQRLDITGGGFNYRKITDGAALSLHAYGIAIDFDPLHNPRIKPLKKTLPDWWYAIMQSWGFSNGCHFPVPDPMHIQFATGA